MQGIIVKNRKHFFLFCLVIIYFSIMRKNYVMKFVLFTMTVDHRFEIGRTLHDEGLMKS